MPQDMGAATALPIGRFLVLMGEINQLVGGLSVVCGRSKDAQSILKKKLRSSHQLETTTRNRPILLDRLPKLALCISYPWPFVFPIRLPLEDSRRLTGLWHIVDQTRIDHLDTFACQELVDLLLIAL